MKFEFSLNFSRITSVCLRNEESTFFFRLIFSSVSFHFARFRYVALFIAIIHVQNKYQVKDNKKIKNEKEKKKKEDGEFNVHALLIMAKISKKYKIKNREILGNVSVIDQIYIYIYIY